MSNRGERLAHVYLGSLLRKLRKFGFHLYTLDVRQHARVHAQVIQQLGPALDGEAESAEEQGTAGHFPDDCGTEAFASAGVHSAIYH